MRILLSFLAFAALVSGAAAHSARLGAPDAGRTALAALPATDADLERAEHRSSMPRQDNLGEVLGIRNGQRALLERSDTRTNGGFSATFDGRGAQLHLRW